MQPHSSPHPFESARRGMALLLIFTHAWSDSFLVFLRCRFGSQYRGNAGVWAVILMIVWAAFFSEHGHDYRPMMVFLALYFLASACHQLMAGWRYLRRIPEQEHSRYSGTPRLMKRFPRLSEMTIKLKVEPIVVTLLGGLLWPINAPLGLYFVGGALCMNASVALVESWQRKQALRMHDMMIEQQQMSDRFRETRGERF